MKLFTKKYTKPKTHDLLLLLLVSLFTLTIILISRSKDITTNLYPSADPQEKTCDIFKGEWVPFTGGTYYTNTTCWTIPDQQNCMKLGRSDTEFMNWRWKPNDCEIPRFNASEFLEIVRGKSLAFVSDSLGGNQMQSLICLLSSVAYPEDISSKYHNNTNYFKHFVYTNYNFTLAFFWSPFLLQSRDSDANGQSKYGIKNLYLDEPDSAWSTKIESFDYLIFSSGNWFFRPLIFYEKGKIIGCNNCGIRSLRQINMMHAYKMAFKTTFKTLIGLKNYKGLTFLRTFSPGHFENGGYDTGGKCLRTKPYPRKDLNFSWFNMEMYLTQKEELKIAKREGKKKGLEFGLMGTTEAMLMRPDGHPDSLVLKKSSDCVHWCLPGPIDMWNEILFYMLK